MGSVEKFFYKHPTTFAILLSVSIMFLIALISPFFPSKISHTVALEILRVIVEVNGVLIGFTGLIITVLATGVGKILRKGIILSGILPILFFLASIFYSLFFMSRLSVQDFITNSDLGSSLTLMYIGIAFIPFLVFYVYPPRRFV